MSTIRQITLTKYSDGQWTAYDTVTETVTDGNTRDEALEKLDDTIDEGTNEPERAPAAPLKELVGLVDDEGAERVKQRSQEFREEFNERINRRRTDRSE